jgi:hypothetical protein
MMLVLLMYKFTKCTVEIGSGYMIYVLISMEIGLGI